MLAGVALTPAALIAALRFAERAADSQDQLIRLVLWTSAFGGMATLLLAAFAAWRLYRDIALPVLELSRAMGALAGGDVSADVPCTGRKDEFGGMAAA
ncbi:MAG TPA: HAMP domain-containing protein, partial [Methylocella sp.]|nr:HAMP domain-containing protein [Methylocella sp.]